MGGSSLKSLRLFQSFSVCLRFFSVIASWFGLFHVASAVLNKCRLFPVVSVFVHVVESY